MKRTRFANNRCLYAATSHHAQYLFTAIILFMVAVCTPSCAHREECATNFIERHNTRYGQVLQSIRQTITIDGNKEDSLFVHTYKSNNVDFKLVFSSSSYQRHFSDQNGDSTLVIYFGSLSKDTLTRQSSMGEKKQGGKFEATIAFIIEPELSAKINALEDKNQVHFVLGNYAFKLEQDLACNIKQMSAAKIEIPSR